MTRNNTAVRPGQLRDAKWGLFLVLGRTRLTSTGPLWLCLTVEGQFHKPGKAMEWLESNLLQMDVAA